MPQLVNTFTRTQLHRETYIAALNGALAARGAKREFANKVGITTQYLSNLLNPFDERHPSRDKAFKMAAHAPIPAEERSELLHHLLMSNPHTTTYVDPNSIASLSHEQALQALKTVADSQFSTYLKRDPEVAKRAIRTALRTGTWAMTRINARREPYVFTEMAIHLHSTASALNMPISAYWYANAIYAVASEPDLWLDSPYAETRHDRIINSLRMLSVTYHNLGLAKKSLDAVRRARKHLNTWGRPETILEWNAHLAMEELNALAITPRFAIADAEYASARGLNSLGFGTEIRKMRDLVGTLINRNLVETYIQHGSSKSIRLAERRVQETFTPDHLLHFGALPHTLHLRTGANLARKVGDTRSYREWIGRAYQLAVDAGLTHQCAEIEYETRAVLI